MVSRKWGVAFGCATNAPEFWRNSVVESKPRVGLKKQDRSKDAPNLSNSLNQRNKSGAFLDSLSLFSLRHF